MSSTAKRTIEVFLRLVNRVLGVFMEPGQQCPGSFVFLALIFHFGCPLTDLYAGGIIKINE
ncbi:MAG: hypothetical protein ABIO24_12685, partial [Saprospiraceae bacterium]